MIRKTLSCILVICFLLFITACTSTPPEEGIPVSAANNNFRESVVYYDSSGYLVPITVSAKWSSSIEKDLIASMTSVPEAYASLALSAPLPEDTSVDVSVSESLATVSLSSPRFESMSSKEAENAVASVVNTLTQFPGIQEVSLSINGNTENYSGINISFPLRTQAINKAYELGDLSAFSVFYEANNGLLVPVTKATNDLTAEVFVNALIRAPKDTENLSTLFPEGTVLKSSVLSEHVLSLDFSKEFLTVQQKENEEKVLSAIAHTCAQLEGVEQIDLYVEGVPYADCIEKSAIKESTSVFSNALVSSLSGNES